MSEPKFTPGPWSYHSDYIWSWKSLDKGGNPRPIAGPANLPSEHEENKANAHLIAAAPELYRALEECADDLTAWISDRYPESDLRFPSIQKDFELDMSVVDKARNALAKARGER